MRIGRKTTAGPGGSAAAGAAARQGTPFSLPTGADQAAGAAGAGVAAAIEGAASPAALLPLAVLREPGRAATGRDVVAAGQGRALLGALSGLHLSALGGDTAQARRTLADLARTLPPTADPNLDGVLRAIAQRAAIELARSE